MVMSGSVGRDLSGVGNIMGLRRIIRNWLFPAAVATKDELERVRGESAAALGDVRAGVSAELNACRLTINELESLQKSYDLVMRVAPSTWAEIYPYLRHSKAQNRQDIFVLAASRLKRNGFFVEFGATNGVDLSNTHMLEKHFGWTGIVAEPAKVWRDALHANRTCFIDEACVWTETGTQVTFRETSIAELSTVSQFTDHDFNAKARGEGREYPVETISLNDLLVKYNAPKEIDFLSVDTEGSELDILRAFDFSRHSFKIIVCEHNYIPQREDIFALLTSKGYERVLMDIAGWDDWYVLTE